MITAFAVGFISFVSPCVLPLVPGYLSTISGVSFADIQEGRGRARVLGPALLFCLSFTAMFVALGMTRHRARADAAGQPRAAAPDLRGRAGGDGRALHRDAVPPAAQSRLAPRAAHAPRPHRRADRRRPGVRGRLAALHRAHARGDPHRGLDRGHRGPGRRAARLLLARPGGAVHPERARLLHVLRPVPLLPRPLPRDHA